jgi:hypothetical protein
VAELAPPDAQAVHHAHPRAARHLGAAAVLAASLNTRTMAPLSMPRAAASSAWISSSGSPSMARRLVTLTKVELRKLRAGGEIIASGYSVELPAGSWLGRWSGRPSTPCAARRSLKNSQRPKAWGSGLRRRARRAAAAVVKPWAAAARRRSRSAEGGAAQRFSSSSAKQGSSKPMRRASSRNTQALLRASPRGATAGRFSSTSVWP